MSATGSQTKPGENRGQLQVERGSQCAKRSSKVNISSGSSIVVYVLRLLYAFFRHLFWPISCLVVSLDLQRNFLDPSSHSPSLSRAALHQFFNFYAFLRFSMEKVLLKLLYLLSHKLFTKLPSICRLRALRSFLPTVDFLYCTLPLSLFAS